MKNPWMSFWLSSALTATNAWTGAARGLWAAEVGRQQRALLDEMTRQTSEFWAGRVPAPARARTRR